MEPIKTESARYAFTAVRDEAGVPHLTAKSLDEAVYAWGYMHGLDRPTQIYFSRAVASGRAAERISSTPELVETDQFFRRAALFRGFRREILQLPAPVKARLQYYCDGVNDALVDARRTLPMWITGFRPQPWDPEAVLLIGNLLSFAGLAVGQQNNERLLVELIQLGIEDRRIRELFEPDLDHVDLELLREIKIERRLSDEALELIADLPRLAGSNAWAVAPHRSASGNALLAADPHLEVNRLPGIWYEVALRWGEGEYALGATLPGAPLMAIGRTNRLAWGVTYMHGDTSDHFIEDCRRGGSCGWQYRRGDNWFDFGLREEIVHRKGGEPLTLKFYENPQGTLLGDPEEGGSGKYLTANWIGASSGAGAAIGTWLDIMASSSAKQAMRVARDCPHPSLVWVFADREGHIGRQASGWFPRRAEIHSGLIPVAAWDDRNHWQGQVDPRALPAEYDPPCGFVVAANECINRLHGPRFNTHPLPDYRKRRIAERLEELPAATLEQMQAIQYDTCSVQARELLPYLLPHFPDGPLKQSLEDWDCCYEPDSVEATLFQSLYRNVVLQVFGHEYGIGWRRMFYLSTRIGFSTMVLTCVDRIIGKEHSSWWEDRDKSRLLRQAAVAAISEPALPWRDVNSFHFTNRFVDVGRVGRLLGLNSPRYPLRGCHATPFQGHLLTTARRESTFAPSYHFVTDLGDDEAWTNVPGGPSERHLSKWYDADVEKWLNGEYKCVRGTERHGDAGSPSD